MSAINTDENGKPVFDASRRIRASVGNSVSKNIEAGAFSRLAQAGAGSVRAKSSENSVEDTIRDTEVKQNVPVSEYMNRIVHTNPKESNIGFKGEEKMNEGQIRIAISNNVFNYSYIVEKGPQKARSLFGLMPTKSETSIKDNLMKLASNVSVNVGSRLVINSVINNKKTSVKDKVIGTAIASGASSIINSGLTITHEDFDRVFDVEGVTKEEKFVASRTANIEAFKFNVVNNIVTKFVPSTVKIGLDKIVPEKIKNNPLYQFGTSLNLLSTISNFAFETGYAKYAMKSSAKHDQFLSDNDVSRKEYVKLMAKTATRNGLAAQINPDMYVSGIMTLVDIVKLGFRAATSVKVEKHVIAKVEKKPVVTPKKVVAPVKKVTKPAVKTTAKK